MNRRPRFILITPAPSDFYNQLIKVLFNLTGVIFGHMTVGNRTLYVTSADIPLKIAQAPKTRPRTTTMDFHVDNKYPSRYQDRNQWIQALTNEVQTKLLAAIAKKNISGAYRARIEAHLDETAVEARGEALEQNHKHNYENIHTYDAFAENCGSAGYG